MTKRECRMGNFFFWGGVQFILRKDEGSSPPLPPRLTHKHQPNRTEALPSHSLVRRLHNEDGALRMVGTVVAHAPQKRPATHST